LSLKYSGSPIISNCRWSCLSLANKSDGMGEGNLKGGLVYTGEFIATTRFKVLPETWWK
jgi:hypothetical protein